MNKYTRKIISVTICAILSIVFIVVMFFCLPSVSAVPETEGEITYWETNKNEDGTISSEKVTKKSGTDFTATCISDLGDLNKLTKVNYVADKFIQPSSLNTDFQIVDLTQPFEFAEKGTLMFIIMNLDSFAEDFDEQAEKLDKYKSGDYWRFSVSLPKIFCASNVYYNSNLVAEHGEIENYNYAEFNTSYDKKTESFSSQTETTLIDINFYPRRGMLNNVYITIHYQSTGGVYSGISECPFIGTKDAVKRINNNSQNLLLSFTILSVVVLAILIVLSVLKYTKEFIAAIIWILGITLLLLTRFILRQETTIPLFWTAAWLTSSFIILSGVLLSIGKNFGKVPTKHIFFTLMLIGALFAFICPFVPFGSAIFLSIVCKGIKIIGAVGLLIFIVLAVLSHEKHDLLQTLCATIIDVAICASLIMPQIFPVQINPIFWLCTITILMTFVSVFIDLRKTENANKYLTANLHLEVARQVKDIRAVIDERDKLLQFVSHDMKKPLASAVTLSDTAIAREKDAEQIKALQIIRQNCVRVVSNLSEIGSYAKFNYITEPSQTVNLLELCSRLYEFHHLDCNANGIILKNLVEKNVQVFAKKQGLENVLSNLIINAVEHANCLSITLYVKALKNNIVLCVEDDGKGISADIEVFKPYVSENNHDTSGIGLYICKNIIESMNGTLTFKTKQGSTIFLITLLKA